jgi:hypothetical protein
VKWLTSVKSSRSNLSISWVCVGSKVIRENGLLDRKRIFASDKPRFRFLDEVIAGGSDSSSLSF